MQWFSQQFRRFGIFIAITFIALSGRSALAVDLIGYLPSYRISASYNNSILPTQLSMLNEVRYFGLTAASDGSIVPLAGTGTLQTNLDRIATIQQIINAL